ncbi:acyltransferase family protein [Leptospira neocaledonica]|uniref:Acyltransferase n=1 Tax=Leptospira neocaledonica TaxID=2023192 RepID=A0A2N0A242_9LEPT|nr:acyltransferase [Leptospira neocaledonica]PJZ78392.1 acyltransferase [Leptospira neocaledonica]
MKSYILSIFASKKGEIESLNGIRAIAILMVMANHLWVFEQRIMGEMPRWLSWFVENQTTIVDVFFVLGGFLNYGGVLQSYKRENSFPFSKFVVNRSLRILPAYYAALAFSYHYFYKQGQKLKYIQNPSRDLLWLINKGQKALDYVWADGIFLSNFFPRVLDVGWYISLEQQIYFLMVVLGPFFLFSKTKKTRVIILSILYIIPFLSRCYLYSKGQMNADALFWTQNRFDSMIAGMLLAEYVDYKPVGESLGKLKYYLIGIIAISFILISYSFGWKHFIRLTLANNFYNIALALIIYLAIQKEGIFKTILALPIFRPLSRITFTVYLWNIPLMGIATKWALEGEKIVTLSVLPKLYLICFGFTILASWPIFLLIEQPFIWWKEKSKVLENKNQTETA